MAQRISICKIRLDLLRRFAILCMLTKHRKPPIRRTVASNMSDGNTPTQVTFPKDGLVRTDEMTATTHNLTITNHSNYAKY
jgi:hypothetical protein